MKRTREFKWGWKLLTVVSSLVLVLGLGLFAEPFSITSSAQSQGKVTATSAKIRKEASTSSDTLGSAARDSVVTINHQVTGADGKVWYQVFVDADTLGYIRSDLVQITDGTTPPTGSNETTNQTPTTNENIADISPVEPMSATVAGSQSVRVRANASTGSQIVSNAQSGLAITVTGQAQGNDGNTWYYVNFIADGSEVKGFIRSDYVTLSGTLVPVTDTPAPPVEDTPAVPDTPEEVPVTKDWDTKYEEGKWYLIDNVTPGTYEIDYIFNTVKDNAQMYEAAQKKADSRQVWIVLLVILVVVLAGALAFILYKVKDIMDSNYFAEVERETIRRRTAERPAGSGRVMHTVGADKRPEGQRPVQNGQRPMQNGQRPVQNGQRSVQNGQRPVQNGQRPVQNGQRPVQNGQRPVQNGQRPVQNGQRPMQNGQRPVQNPQRPVQEEAMQRPVQEEAAQNETMQPTRPAQQPARPKPQEPAQDQGWKSKNFMTEEDEFEFEFLNWDGEEEQ